MPTPIANGFLDAAFRQEMPIAYWPLFEPSGSTQVSELVNGFTGTISGSVTLGQTGPLAATNLNFAAQSAGGIIQYAAGSAVLTPARLSVMAWVKYTSSGASASAFVSASNGAGGLSFALRKQAATGKIEWKLLDSVGGTIADLVSPLAYNDGNWHLIIGMYDPLVAGGAALIVDGLLVASVATAPVLIGYSATGFVQIADSSFGSNMSIAHVAIYPYYFVSGTITAALWAARLRGNGPSDKYLTVARSGILRSGAGRSGGFVTKPKMLVNGGATDAMLQTTYGVEKKSLRLKNILGTQPNTLSFSMWQRPTGAALPLAIDVGSLVNLYDGAGNNPLFTGQVQRPTSLPSPAPGGVGAGVQRFEIEVSDQQWLLNNLTVTAQYATGQSGSAVARDIIARTAGYGQPFTTKYVQDGAPTLTAPLTFKAEKLGNALTRLCQSLSPNWYWRVDPNGVDVHFFLSETQFYRPLALIPGTYSYTSLRQTRDLAQIRTRMYVEGGGGTTTADVALGATSIPVSETSWYDASLFPLATGIVLSQSQVITIKFTGRSVASGAGNLTGVPASGAGSITNALPSGDQLSLWVQVDDSAAQVALSTLLAGAGGGGIVEQPLSVSNGTYAMCKAAALSELAAYKSVLVTGSLLTYDKSVHEGQNISVALVAARASQTFIVPATILTVERSLAATGRWHATVTYGTLWRNIIDVMKRAGSTR